MNLFWLLFLVFWIVLIVFPDILAYLLWWFFIFLWINILIFFRALNSKKSGENYVKFGKYKIYR